MQKWQLDRYLALLREGTQFTKFSFIGIDNHCWTFNIQQPITKDIFNLMPTNLRNLIEKETTTNN